SGIGRDLAPARRASYSRGAGWRHAVRVRAEGKLSDRAKREPEKALFNSMYPVRTEVGETAPVEARNTREFVQALRDLHIWAGKPSMRELEARTGSHVSKSTFHKMLNEDRLPRFDTLEAFLKACKVEYREAWIRKWRLLTRDQDVTAARRGTV
ncbi:hypothetical protein ACFVYE_43140, partial [Streptomyces sp. NPDC058239]